MNYGREIRRIIIKEAELFELIAPSLYYELKSKYNTNHSRIPKPEQLKDFERIAKVLKYRVRK